MRSVAVLLLSTILLAGCGSSAAAGLAASASAGATEPGATEPGATEPGASPSIGLVDIGAGLQGPDGLAASAYATGLPNVAALAFDADGRLWAATAAFDDAGTDTISVIAAADATPQTVIDGQHTVLGLVWIDDTLFVASKETVTAWTGFDGSAFASHRTVVAFAVGVGEVNQIVVAPSGRLVVGISAPCNACATTDPNSAAIVSFLRDGSDLRVEASGIRAPVGLAFYPGTDDLYVTMNQRDDLADLTPGDWLAVVGSGQDWGFPDCYGQAAGACADEPQPVAVLDAHAAASGVAIVTGQLGTTIGTSALVAEWAKGVILQVELTATTTDAGAAGTASPFLTGLTNPVAVILDGSGGILVGDWATGTIFRIAAAA